MMQLRKGIYYLAADGSKRGPMKLRPSGQFYEEGRAFAMDPEWDERGVNMQIAKDGTKLDLAPDLIAEWVDAAPPKTDATLAADLRAKLSEAAAIATHLDAAGWTVEVIGDRKTATTGADALTLTANITRMKEERL